MNLTRATPDAAAQSIAIIGAACRLPGAPSLDALASLLAAGQDAVTEIPAERWSRALFEHPDPASPGKSYSFAAGCLAQIDGFDPAYFGISPREAAQMDPQQRLLLELAVEALEDCGIRPGALAGSRTSVHVGGSSSDYVTLRLGDPSGADAYFMTGSTLCSLSNRISHAFDLCGPSFTVDSACSSSLVALHLACEGLRRGEAELALAGGVNLLLAPQSFVGFSRAGMLSPSGRCRAFDAAADGYVRAEGGGVVVLKPLLAALADNDPVHAVIRATAVNSDGRTAGFSLPSEAAQAALLQEAYDRAGVRAADLVYLEAHGTGTKVGDPIEAGAIGAVLGSRRARKLPIGSVKTNIGHLEAASGIAGLMKLLVAFRTRTVPASLHLATPNPAIPFAALNLSLVTAPLQVPAGPKAAMGINSFGFGGTNAHAVLQGPPARAPEAPGLAPPPMLLLSARTEPALTALADAWRGLLTAAAPEDFGGLLRGAARGRELQPCRLAVLGDSAAELATALERYASGKASAAVIAGAALRETGGVAFVYAGNGSQWAGMAQDALAHSCAFAAALDETDAALAPLLGWSVRAALATPDAAGLRRIEVAQPLLFAVQVASVAALRAAGVVADAHLGHSAGEVAAAHACGALNLADACAVIVLRSRHQQTRHGVGRMAVLGLGEAAAQAAIADLHGLCLAAVNSRVAVTVGGPEPALAALAARAAERGWSLVRLDLDYAFHSPAMDPIRAGLMADLAGLQPSATHSAFVSSVTGEALEGTALDAGYWWRNVRAPVRFADAAAALLARGTRLFMEIGPQAVLQGFLRDALEAGGVAGRALPTLTRRPAGGDPFLIAAARCHVAGYDVSTGPLFDGPAAFRALPHYPWQRERAWFTRSTEATDLLGAPRVHPLLGFRRGGDAACWFNHMDLATQPWIGDHVVAGTALLPAAAMIDMALAACAQSHPEAGVHELWDVEISRPVGFEPGAALELGFSHDADGRFTLFSRARLSGEPATAHATGRLSAGTAGAALTAERAETAGHTLEAAAFYALTGRLGLAYGPTFRSVRAFGADGPQSGWVEFGGAPAAYAAMIDPLRLDGALQGLAALVALGRPHAETACVLPVRFGRVRLLARGAVAARAQVRITQAGPRAVCGTILLLDAEGRPVLEALDCWCVARTDATGRAPTPILAPVWIPTQTAELAPLDPSAVAGWRAAGESQMLADAFLAGAAFDAIGTVLRGERTFVPVQLAAAGRIASAALPMLEMLAAWLEQDGLARRQGAQVLLATENPLPPGTQMFGSLLFDVPEHSAEAALLAWLADGLPALLRGETMAAPAGLIDQFLHDGPSAVAMIEAVEAAFARVVRDLPAGRRLRVVQLNATRGGLTRRILAQCAGRAGLSYVAVAGNADAVPGLEALLGCVADARVVVAGSAAAAALRDFDVAVGVHALTSQGGAAPLLASALRRGGVALLAEPAPGRLWQALAVAGLGCTGGLYAAEHWGTVLADAGFGAVAQHRVKSPFWAAGLIAATCLGGAAGAATAPPTSLLACAPVQSGCRPWPAVLPGTARCDLRALPGILTERSGLTLVLLVPAPAQNAGTDAMGGVLAQLAALAPAFEQAADLSVVLAVQAAAEGDPFGAAMQGFRRVLVNETGLTRCRLLRIDPGFSAAEAAALLERELCCADGEDEVAWTSAGRFVPRLRRRAPAAAAAGPVLLDVERPGLLATLGWQSLVPRAPGAGEVHLEVTAAGLNFRDLMWALGLLPDEALLRGFAGPTLGLECAGRVLQVGEGVRGLTVGMRVMGLAPAALASQAVTGAHALLPIPDGMTDEEATTIPVAFLTVAYALGHLAQLAAGERVLIHGAAGGVGLAAIQYARARGAEIFATAGSPAKRAVLRKLGVEHVLDSRGLEFADEVLRLTGGEGVDVVLNCLSGAAMERSLGLLRPFGRFLELGKRDLYGNTGVGLRPLRHNATYFAVDADQLPVARPALAARLLAEIGALLREGIVRPLPYRRFDFAAAEDACRLMQASGHVGKIVLTPGKAPPGPRAPESWRARADGTYVLTGALSGFGRSAALWLIARGARRIAVLSRRGPDHPAAVALAQDCAAAGGRLLALACDVADGAAMAVALAQIRATLPPIVGVMHCAMVLDDALLPHQSAGRLAAVLRPKLDGAEALDRLTRDDPVELFVLFGSIVSSLGNPGQAGYVAANAALEAIAERRHAAGLPALAVAWGPIADAGVLERDAAVSAQLARWIGGQHMPAARALAALPALLAAGLPVLAFADVPWGAARAQLPALRGRFTQDLADAAAPAPAAEDFRASLATLTPEQARARVAELLIAQLAEILRLAPSRIDPETPLADLGMDSLMAVELRIAVERRVGLSLPLLSLSSGLTPAAMAARLVRALGDPAQQPDMADLLARHEPAEAREVAAVEP